ncbi:exodeoxyribonuclease VII large subunit [Apilactobacillus apinorum]|uniref:exodeoxyribonuclease VII large subunit n=1 Tax=Apilactobacillus apinorum TaxID=1218495 RepID=UPI0006B4C2DD|nr:exodeoxyribonuclease VII large subunit [Apilactobacillus apinorum]KOY68853.1 Exodeoxyribonuclease 7 large subunit [Apilactobacillus apinorum]CAI2669478.1 xseA Exodeoxyribonuclease 7 large subunit [Apilactobacillus apinorum]
MDNDYLTVTDLTNYIKKKFDRDPYLGKVYLTGEISNFRLRPVHQYFSLKDDNAKISAIMFKSAFSKIKFKPEEGMKVLVTGRISLYEATGNYQIYIESMEPDGVGALYQAYEQLKKKLSAEGLFNAPKRTLEKYPKKIAVVTSPSGAVIRDIITTARRRYPIAQIVLYPAVVQGTAAAEDIVRQIKRVNQKGDYDTLIIGRGGGSIEDLWPFNEEIVAREIANSNIPVISSVGHETDTTIADLVADVRAATPTAAAELAVPVLTDVITDIKNNEIRIVNAYKNKIIQLQQRLNKITSSYIFKQPERLYDSYVQRIDMLNERLNNALQQSINSADKRINDLIYNLKINSPKNRINEQKQILKVEQKQLLRNISLLLENKDNKVKQLISSLDHLSPLKVMSRGFSYTTDSNGNVIKKISDVKKDDEIQLKLIDGTAKATVNEITKESK